jgi:O-antigen ligase
MPVAVGSYHYRLLPASLLFFVCGVTAILTGWHILIVIPFAWILLQPVYQYITVKADRFFWLFLILLPLSTEINVTPQLGMDFPDECLLMLLTGLTLIKIIHEPRWFPRTLSVHPLFMVLVIYFGWLIITCVWSIETWPSVKYLLAKIWYIIPLVLLPQQILTGKQGFRKMALLLLIPMFFVVVQALVRHAFYGFSFESIKHIFDPFFRNHVSYSAMLVCLLAVAWCVWKLTPPSHPKRKWIATGIIIGLAGLFFAYSRGAWAALLAGILAVWTIRRKLVGWLIATAVIAVIISTAWLVTDKYYLRFAPDHDRTVFHTDFGEHMSATVNMKDVSTAERFYRWVAGARMLAEKPATGFGPNTFYPHYQQYTVRSFETWVSANPEHSTVHNYFLLVASEQGIAGLALFCILFFGMIIYTQRLYHTLQDRFYKMIALTAGVVLVMIGVINFMSDMIETDKIGGLFWLCLGVIILLEQKNIEQGVSNNEANRNRNR